MMQPDRSYYEIWIADWLAGNLDSEQIKLFQEFLDRNPDLKEEAESLLVTAVSPEKISFKGKERFKRSAKDLTPAQVEYLSVACLENDLSPEQLDDLNECTDNDPDLRELSESVRRMKLIPPDYKYLFKERLRKRTMTEEILRLSIKALSAAATVAILVFISVLISREIKQRINLTATDETREIEPVILYSEVLYESEDESPPAISQKVNDAVDRALIPDTGSDDQSAVSVTDDNNLTNLRASLLTGPGEIRTAGLPDFNISVIKEPLNYTLVASNVPYREPLYDDRNGLTRFLARTFREKILREDTGSDAPVRPYEIASAGINGISRLFGFEMALVSITDDQGELKSLYFSSRLLKINAPVKKDEAMQ
ncbi:MAG TPA: hypothetical protein DDW27_02175 [Bacteroidales bacterium]|nr:hypothetical protein [Bacteroidales bacterium]